MKRKNVLFKSKNDLNSVFILKVRSLNKKTNFAPEIRREKGNHYNEPRPS